MYPSDGGLKLSVVCRGSRALHDGQLAEWRRDDG